MALSIARRLGASAVLSFALTCLGFAAEVPRAASDLTINIDGKMVHPGDYKGKVLCLVVMSPTCPHCQNLTQTLNGISRDLAPKGLQVLEVAFREMDPYIPQFRDQFKPAFPVGSSTRPEIESFMQHSVMMRFMVPQMVIIDRKGTVRVQLDAGSPTFENAAALRQVFETYLNEAPGARASAAKK